MEMFGKKKSKKKKKPFSMDDMSDALPESKDNGVAVGEDREPPAVQPAEVDDFDLDMDFTKAKKKKTKKKKVVLNDLIAKEDAVPDTDDPELGKRRDLSILVHVTSFMAISQSSPTYNESTSVEVCLSDLVILFIVYYYCLIISSFSVIIYLHI